MGKAMVQDTCKECGRKYWRDMTEDELFDSMEQEILLLSQIVEPGTNTAVHQKQREAYRQNLIESIDCLASMYDTLCEMRNAAE